MKRAGGIIELLIAFLLMTLLVACFLKIAITKNEEFKNANSVQQNEVQTPQEVLEPTNETVEEPPSEQIEEQEEIQNSGTEESTIEGNPEQTEETENLEPPKDLPKYEDEVNTKEFAESSENSTNNLPE